MPDLSPLDIPIKTAFNDALIEASFTAPCFVGLLMALQMHYNRDLPAVDIGGVKGGAKTFLLRTQNGKWKGSQQLQDDEATIQRIERKTTLKEASVNASALEYSEGIDKFDINRYMGDERLQVDLVETIVGGAMNGLAETIQEQLFPYSATQLNLDANAGILPGTRESLPDISRFFRSGYAGNAATGSGSYYPYAGVDYNALNNPTRAKAVQWGTSSGSATLSKKNFLANVIAPMRVRGAKRIFTLCDSAVYHYFWDTITDKLQHHGENFLQWGGSSFGLDENTIFVYEPALDALPANSGYREMFACSFDTWNFNFEDVRKRSGTVINVHDKVPGMPSKVVVDGYVELALACKDIGQQGHVYNAVIP